MTAPSHPSPHRDRVSLVALWFGMLGAGAVWVAQLVANYMIVTTRCYGGSTPVMRAFPPGAGLRPLLLAVNLLALVVALLAMATAYRTWRLTREEHPGEAGHAMEVGEGRTRFMGLVGIYTSGGFVLAVLFDTVTLFVVPLCGG
jgi:hypothetical protein